MKRMHIITLLLILCPGTARGADWLDQIDGMLWSNGDARSAYEHQQFKEAARGFAADAHDPAAAYNAGVAHYRAGEKDEAMRQFQKASLSSDLGLRSQALANEGLLHVEAGDLETAQTKLQDALSYANDNQAIQENLAWVNEQLKQRKPEDKKSDENKAQQDKGEKGESKEQQASQEKGQKTPADEAQKSEQESAANKPAEEKAAGDSSGAQKDPKGQDSGQEAAEQKQTAEKEAAGDQAGKEARSKEPSQDSLQKDEKGDQKLAEKGQSPDGKTSGDNKSLQLQEGPNQASQAGGEGKKSEHEAQLSMKELKVQEAEKLLRSVDDQIGRYPWIETEATGSKGNHDKNW